MDKNPEGLEVGSIVPDFTVKNLCAVEEFNILQLAKNHRGILISFIRANW